MTVTKYRSQILQAFEEWFKQNQIAPTLEELCQELGMKASQKGTLQKRLQTMRGIDLEWDDNMPRSYRLLRQENLENQSLISVTETVRYLATGLVEWENLAPEKRDFSPKALRLGMSRVYFHSLLKNEKDVPENLTQLWQWAEKPLREWQPSTDIKYLSDEVSLIDNGELTDFTCQWNLSGNNVILEAQEKVLQDVLEYCRLHQLEEEYRIYRQLIITHPVLPYAEFIQQCSLLRPLREFLQQSYLNLVDLAEEETYHFCPRCGYLQEEKQGFYHCTNHHCNCLATKLKKPAVTISKDKANTYKIITPGIYRYGTLPGIAELYLTEELRKLGLKVTLYPEIDEYDLLVEFTKKKRWAIDVKDWSSLDEERLQKVDYRRDTSATFIVFPDEREAELRIKVRRKELEKNLNGIKLKLTSEIIYMAKNQLGGKSNA